MPPSNLPGPAPQTLETWLSRFDASWGDGQLEAFVRALPPPGHPLRLPALVGLVKRDLQRQWARGRRPRVEGYLRSYPELGAPGTAPVELLLAEYEARQQQGAPADLAEFGRRFPGRAEALRDRLPAPATVAATMATAGPAPAPPAAPGPGELPEPFGHYRIVRKLGQGGMGTVYLAHDLQLDRPVALKVPRFSAQDGPAVLDRFYQEVKAAATLDHPNICPVYEAGCVGGVHYMTMAYVEGRPLSAFVRPGKPWLPRQAVLLVRKLALVAHEAHVKGVIHRDLKPANVMINKRREPVVMDFGLARRATAGDARLTADGSAMGTPAYMAPEQARGDVAAMGPGCDVYSLGVILYELLAGELPFRGRVVEVLAQVLHAEPRPPSAVRPGLDPALEAICLQAMAKDVRRRTGSALELANELKAWADAAAAPATAIPAEIPEAVPAEDTEVVSVQPAPAAGPSRGILPWVVGGAVAVLAVLLVSVLTIVLLLRPRSPTPAVAETPPPDTVPQGPQLPPDKPQPVVPPPEPPFPPAAPPPPRDEYDAVVAGDVAECAKLLQGGKGSKEYVDKVGPGRIPIWRAAAEGGSPGAQWLLARCYQEGVGVAKDPERAVELLRQAADKGLAYAENNLGAHYHKGEGARKDLREAVRWYRKAADKGLAIAQENLGLCYKDGEGVKQDWAAAREWFRKAAEQGTPTAQYQLAVIYFNGHGLAKPDQAEAARWYRRAAEAGDGFAQDMLGRIYANGWGVSKGPAEGARWFRKAAEGGNVEGQGDLGRAYLNGQGVAQSDAEAVRWLEKAVAQNVPHAPTNRSYRWSLGSALHNLGNSALAKKDTDAAFLHYRRAADVREKLVEEVPYHLLHRRNLSITYIGLGDLRAAVKDYARAAKWYGKASDLGDGVASKKLADLYANGQGVPKGPEEERRLRKLAEDQKVIKFTIPCHVRGQPQKVPLDVYVTNAFQGGQPLEQEERRLLADHDATLPREVKDSFTRLHAVARENNVSFVDLAVRALGKK
jgi:TPR repeat protein